MAITGSGKCVKNYKFRFYARIILAVNQESAIHFVIYYAHPLFDMKNNLVYYLGNERMATGAVAKKWIIEKTNRI